MSPVTSIGGTPQGAGGIPDSSNFANELQWAVIDALPSKTSIITQELLLADVEKI